MVTSRAQPAGRRVRAQSQNDPRDNAEESDQRHSRCAAQSCYTHALNGTLHAQLPEGWLHSEPLKFQLEAGAQKLVTLPVAVPESAAAKDYAIALDIALDGIAALTRPLALSVISPEMLGNLLANGDFEIENPKKKDTAAVWGGATLASSEGLGLGLGKNVVKIEKVPANYVSIGQNILGHPWRRTRILIPHGFGTKTKHAGLEHHAHVSPTARAIRN